MFMVTVASEMLLPEVRQLCPWEREASEVSHVPVCGGWSFILAVLRLLLQGRRAALCAIGSLVAVCAFSYPTV